MAAILKIRDSGKRQEEQLITTVGDVVNERQAVILRAPYGANRAEHAEVQLLTVDSTSTMITLEHNSSQATFANNADAENIQTILRSNLYFLAGAVVERVSEAGVTDPVFSITFDKSFGNVAPLRPVSSLNTTVQTHLEGGVSSILNITLSSLPTAGYFTLGLDGAVTTNIYFDATASDLEQALSAVSTIGAVRVSLNHENATLIPIWTVTFLSRFGDVSSLDSNSTLGLGVDVLVSKVRSGTTQLLSGVFSLTLFGETTEPFNVSSVTGKEVETALNELANVSVTVQKFSFINNGIMLLIDYSLPIGDVPTIELDSSGVLGTALNSAVVTQQDGSSIGGSFMLYRIGVSDDEFNHLDHRVLSPILR